MSWTPISGSAVQYMQDSVAANDHYIKFYASGTTTPISMATDSTGGTTLAKAQFNAQGYAINGSGDEFIPHIDQKYKVVFYPNATDADNNIFANAVYNIDLLGQLATVTSGAFPKNFATLAIAQADNGLVVSDTLELAEYRTGGGGGGTWDVVLLSSVTVNGANIVAWDENTGAGTDLALTLRIGDNANLLQFGAYRDGVTDSTSFRDEWLLALGSGVFESTIVGPREGFIPAGKYVFTNTTTIPTNSTVRGVSKQSVILPTLTASTAVIQATGSTLEDIVILGTNCTGASIGLDIGSTGLTSNTWTRKLNINGFDGAGGIGLDLSNAVTCNFDRVVCDDNYDGAHLFQSGSTTLPSNCDFKACEFKSNDNYGAHIEGGSNVTFSPSCNFELNGEEGVFAKSGTGAEISNLILHSPWVEANKQNYASGATRNAEYQFFLRGRSIRVNDAHFFGNSNEAKAMHIESSLDFVIDHCEVPNQNGIILADGTSAGNFLNFPEVSGDFNSLVTDSSTGNVNNLDTKYGSYTPGITFATPGDLNVVYAVQNAYWTQTGQTVSLNFFITTSTFTHSTASGKLTVDLGPFTSANKTNFLAMGSLAWGGITKTNYTQVAPRVLGNSTSLDFMASGSGQVQATVDAADLPSGGALVLEGSVTFEATNP